jgi:hypothetical protein
LTENKRTIEQYMAGFRATDHALILSCLTDDVEWDIPGMFHSRGKAAFDQEIENDAFVGHSDIVVTRMIEEENVVMAKARSGRRSATVVSSASGSAMSLSWKRGRLSA